MATVREIQSRSCLPKLLRIKRQMGGRNQPLGKQLDELVELYESRQTHIAELSSVFGDAVMRKVWKAADIAYTRRLKADLKARKIEQAAKWSEVQPPEHRARNLVA